MQKTTEASDQHERPVDDFLKQDLDTFMPLAMDQQIFLKAVAAEGLAPGLHMCVSLVPGLRVWMDLLVLPSEASIQDFLQAVAEGWQPLPGTAGAECIEIMQAMSWTGRNAAKRLVKTVYADLETWQAVVLSCFTPCGQAYSTCTFQEAYRDRAARCVCRRLLDEDERPSDACKPVDTERNRKKASKTETVLRCSSALLNLEYHRSESK